jgi:hypothetical protein
MNFLLLVGQDEETDVVLLDQRFDLVHDLDRIADAVVAPEFPLAAEAAGERAAAREIRNRQPLAHRDVDVLVPIEDAPVGLDAVEVLDRRLGRCGDHLVAFQIGDAAHTVAVARPAAVIDRGDEVQEHLFALAPHDGVDPRRLFQHLRVHEGGMDAAQHGDDRRVHFLGDLQDPFGLVDRRRDRRAADDVRPQFDQARTHRVLVEVVRHRVDESHVCVAARLEIPDEVGDPGRRPVARDLGATGVVVRVNENDAHA